ncbi:GntR family transcriptional regulator [Streptomyces sp. NEAU-Y11]|uniref:GntR family transcriptional regulator n=1 Tax=Streptomyces cucumeris TaxID=2962890 RepID=UPI0035ABE8C3
MSEETPAERIAGDLALAIHLRMIRAGEALPSQSKIMSSYGVATGTAASALAKLRRAGLTRGEAGRGTFVLERPPMKANPVLDVMAAASMCRALSSTTFPAGTTHPTLDVGGDPDWEHSDRDPEKVIPPRRVDVSTLTTLDRSLLRWMSEAFLSAARRLVGNGPTEADQHLIDSARAILRDGAKRPDRQPAIAEFGGPKPPDEDVALRIWPERARQDHGDPLVPFLVENM